MSISTLLSAIIDTIFSSVSSGLTRDSSSVTSLLSEATISNSVSSKSDDARKSDTSTDVQTTSTSQQATSTDLQTTSVDEKTTIVDEKTTSVRGIKNSLISIITTLSVPSNYSLVYNNNYKVNQTYTETVVLSSLVVPLTSYTTNVRTLTIQGSYETLAQIPITTFGYVYTQPYQVTDKKTSFGTSVPATVTVVTYQQATLVELQSFQTLTVDMSYYKNILHGDVPTFSSNKTPKLAGSIAGSICGVLLLVLMGWFMWSRRNRKSETVSEKSSNPFSEPSFAKSMMSKFKKAPPIDRRQSVETVNSATSTVSTAGSDNGLFAIRDNLLQGVNKASSLGMFKKSMNHHRKVTDYPRDRIIDTVYEESSESLNSSRRSSVALTAKKYKKRKQRNRVEKHVPYYNRNAGHLNERYSRAGLRNYCNNENPFEPRKITDDYLKEEELSGNEFDEIHRVPVPPPPRKLITGSSAAPKSPGISPKQSPTDTNLKRRSYDSASSGEPFLARD